MRPIPQLLRSTRAPRPVALALLGLAWLTLLAPHALAAENPAPAAPTTNAPAPAPETSVASTNTPDATSTHAAPESAEPGTAASTNAAPAASRLDYPAFRLIADRNIFNTTRSPRRPGGGRPREVRRTPKVESISLVGTLAYEKGRFAFFEGSSSEYRKVLRQGESIAGHTIESISQSGIKLTQEDRVLHLKVSQHLRREDDGPWQLSDAAAAPAAAASTASTASTPSTNSDTPSSDSTSPASSGGGEVSDVLKRLMQQREKELK